MGHGTPDWGQTAGVITTYQLTDLAELAARMGSIVTHDRRGDVFFLDAFEDGLVRWEPDMSGSGASVSLSAVKAKRGTTSALLTPGTSDGDEALIKTHTALPSLSRIGVEFAFLKPGTVTRLEWQLWARGADDSIRAAIRYDDVNSELQYRDAVTGYTAFATGVDLFVSNWAWHVIKLVVDPARREYVRLILDATEYDLTGKAASVTTLPEVGVIEVETRTRRIAAGNSILYVDDVIFTQNEPAPP